MVEMKTRTALSAGIVFMMVGAGIAGCLGIFDWQAQAYSGNLKTFDSYNELTAFIKKGQEYAGGTRQIGLQGELILPVEKARLQHPQVQAAPPTIPKQIFRLQGWMRQTL